MLKVYENYLAKRALFPAWIHQAVAKDLSIVVVIPAYRETELFETLESLKQCQLPEASIEVLIVLNDREQDEPEVRSYHQAQYAKLKTWCATEGQEGFQFFPIYAERLPRKKAGVGLARKIGLDEGIRRFAAAQQAGILVCLDADTLVAKNYFLALHNYFLQHPKSPAASIAYAHRLEGLPDASRRAILQYELHLRIFLAAKRWAGFPFAYETIGSAMAVRADKYCEQGGMNTRKAGEDFYFLNKFIPLGNFGEINSTTVYPSARISERVPFGTGRAMQDILENGKSWLTYPPETFEVLRAFFNHVKGDETLAKTIQKEQPQVIDYLWEYLRLENFEKVAKEIRKNTSSKEAFEKRFFRWFDAFRLMKFLHYCLEQGLEKVSVVEAGHWLGRVAWQMEWPRGGAPMQEEEFLLMQFREMSRIEFKG